MNSLPSHSLSLCSRTILTLNIVLLGLICILNLSSCSTLPQVSPLESDANAATLKKAQQLYQAGEYSLAAEQFTLLSNSVPPPWKQQMQVEAAQALFADAQIEQAVALTQSIQESSADAATVKKLLELRLQLIDKIEDIDTALPLINQQQYQKLSHEQQIRLLQRQSYLFDQQERHLESAQALIKLTALIDEPAALLPYQQMIWQQLNKLEFDNLNALMPPPPDDEGGWIELAYFSRLYAKTPSTLDSEIKSWSSRYPKHSALANLEALLAGVRTKIWENPQQIALLLPLSGRLGEVGKMIQDGFVSGHLEFFHLQKPTLRIYDVGESPARILSVYQQAVAEGADAVIGPLDKSSFDHLIRYGEISVPVLGLNYLSEDIEPPPGVFQFGLLPEDEAADAARHARRKGLKRALILIPDNDLGIRYANSFRKTFVAEGGTVLDEMEFDNQANDFSPSITALMKIDASRQRHQELTRLLGTRLEYEPRRREDSDMIFLAATPLQARLIRPQLLFHRSGELPVYAPSRVSTGQINPAADPDLNGIFFVDIPWLLSASQTPFVANINQSRPERFDRFARFFTLGFDAARLIDEIPLMLNNPNHQHQGYSGYLTLSKDNRIVRKLDLAEFVNGRPRYRP